MTARAACAAALGLALAGGASAEPPAPFPLAIGGPFALQDQHGAARGAADPDGRAQILFFGYASCRQICSAALPTMAAAVEVLAAEGHAVTPVMITVDPAQDRPETMGPALAAHHPDFVGLTGAGPALAAAYAAFGVEVTELFTDPEHGPVYAHGSFLYLLDAEGRVLTLIPPVLAAEEVARIARPYLGDAG